MRLFVGFVALFALLGTSGQARMPVPRLLLVALPGTTGQARMPVPRLLVARNSQTIQLQSRI